MTTEKMKKLMAKNEIMRLGETVRKRINSSATRGDYNKGFPEEKVYHYGRVIYVHPLGRFYTAEFRFRHGSIRESYDI